MSHECHAAGCQETTKNPTAAYMAVQQCAVAWLARRSGLDEAVAAAASSAVMYEALCREKGQDPLKGLPRAWESES